MDVRGDGRRQVVRGELVAELTLSGAESDRRRAGADGIAGGGLSLAGEGDLEGAPARGWRQQCLRATAARCRDNVPGVLEMRP